MLKTTVNQMGDTRFSTVYLTLNSVRQVYEQLCELLDRCGESEQIVISSDVLDFLVEFLQPFYDAQHEPEGEKYTTINLMHLWFEKLKRHCQRVATDTPYQAVIHNRHLWWITRKIEIKEQHKIATFLWPKYSQLRMLAPAERRDPNNTEAAALQYYGPSAARHVLNP